MAEKKTPVMIEKKRGTRKKRGRYKDTELMGRPYSFESPQDMWEKFADYKAQCEKKSKPMTLLKFCVHCQICRQTLYNYLTDVNFLDTVKKIKAEIEADIESRALDGSVNVTAAIFNLKNNFGQTDRQETQHTGTVDIVAIAGQVNQEAEKIIEMEKMAKEIAEKDRKKLTYEEKE